MDRPIPRRATRAAVHECLLGLLRAAHADYWGDMPFIDACETVMIMAETLLAELNGTPYRSQEKLARSLGMSRVTLERRLARLQRRGVIDHSDGAYRVSVALMGSRTGDAAIRRSRQIILTAAKKLSKLD